MSYKLIATGNSSNIPVNTYYCDAVSDLTDLPENAPMGSVAYIIAPDPGDGKLYMKKSDGDWVSQ